jgi:hypothetical protein
MTQKIIVERIHLNRLRYRISAVAYWLDSSPDYVYALIRKGRLEAASSSVGKKGLFVSHDSLVRFLEETRIPLEYWSDRHE